MELIDHKGMEINEMYLSKRNEGNGIKWNDRKLREDEEVGGEGRKDFNFPHLCLVKRWKTEWIENRISINLFSCLCKEKKKYFYGIK